VVEETSTFTLSDNSFVSNDGNITGGAIFVMPAGTAIRNTGTIEVDKPIEISGAGDFVNDGTLIFSSNLTNNIEASFVSNGNTQIRNTRVNFESAITQQSGIVLLDQAIIQGPKSRSRIIIYHSCIIH
jgi:hypothetical protein